MAKRTVRVGLAVAAVLALGVAAVVVVLALPIAGPGRDVRHHTPSGPRVPAPPASHPLVLVTGSRWVNGIYTRYPATLAGAVSAAVDFMTQLGSTLDPDRAATVARLTADRSYLAAENDAAASAIAARRAVSLPPSGPLPPGTAAFLVPVMYQVPGGVSGVVPPARLTVLLLFNYTVTAPSGVTEHVGVTAVRLMWTPDSWRLIPPPDVDLAALLATPGTASATAKGWKAMTNAV